MKAFDNILHTFLLGTISSLGLGKHFHDYTRSFLAYREAILKVGDLSSDTVSFGSRGTPQGSVILPTLFNLAKNGLSRKPSELDGITHTIYADDVTIWFTGSSDGRLEAALQDAIEVAQDYLRPTGLRWSRWKSELLLYRPKRRGCKPRGWRRVQDIGITLRTSEGCLIPRVDSLRVLGMTIESIGSNKQTVIKLTRKTDNAIRLIRRVTNRQQGLSEDNVVRLVHAFVMCD